MTSLMILTQRNVTQEYFDKVQLNIHVYAHILFKIVLQKFICAHLLLTETFSVASTICQWQSATVYGSWVR